MMNRILQTVFLLLVLSMPGTGCRNAMDSGSMLGPDDEVRFSGTLSIRPATPYTTDTLHAVLSRGTVSEYTFQWTRNGRLLHVYGNVLSPSNFFKGDTIRVKATLRASGKDELSDSVVIANSPPRVLEMSLRIDSGPEGRFFKTEVTTEDADQDSVDYECEWWLNGKRVQGNHSDRLPITGLKRGDIVQVKVLPEDGISRGIMRCSSYYRIPNTSPEIISEAPASLTSNGDYEYQVVAVDRDRDILRYGLEDAPGGMSIEPDTGRLFWDIGKITHGQFRVKVAVSDGFDKTSEVFTIVINSKSS